MQKLLVFIITIFFLAGCTSVQQYPGPKISQDKIAVIVKSDQNYPGQFYVSQINGKDRGIGMSDRYEFLPGPVSILVNYSSATLFGKPIEINETLSAGKVYSLKFKIYKDSWKAWIEEI